MVDRLVDVTAGTGGPFTTAMARAVGYSDAGIRRLLRTGAWTVLRRGVYVETSVAARAAASPQRRHALEVAGLLLALDARAVAGGESAALIWGLETMSAAGSKPMVVSDDATLPARNRDGYTVRKATVPDSHRRVRHGVAVTSPARTAIDLARAATFRDGVVAADSALRTGLASRRQLSEILADCHCWPGIAAAQRAVRFADPKSESVLESVSRVSMHVEDLPVPRTQVVLGDGRDRYVRVDFLWDEVKVIGEADGVGKYLPDGRRDTYEIVRAEKRREEWLADAGFEIVRWGWAEANDPPRLAARLSAAFARGAERRRGRGAA